MACGHCEDFLQLAIEAFGWTQRATREFRDNSLGESAESFADGLRALRLLRDAWIEFASAVLASSEKLVSLGFSVNDLNRLDSYRAQMRQIASEEDKMTQIALKVPSAEELSLIAIDPPREWIDEPAWTTD